MFFFETQCIIDAKKEIDKLIKMQQNTYRLYLFNQ